MRPDGDQQLTEVVHENRNAMIATLVAIHDGHFDQDERQNTSREFLLSVAMAPLVDHPETQEDFKEREWSTDRDELVTRKTRSLSRFLFLALVSASKLLSDNFPRAPSPRRAVCRPLRSRSSAISSFVVTLISRGRRPRSVSCGSSRSRGRRSEFIPRVLLAARRGCGRSP